MYIRRYADLPGLYVPPEGEVVCVARSRAGPYCLAAVVKVRRAARDRIRIDFVWLESAPHSPANKPPVTGESGHVYVSEDDPIPLVRRVPRGYLPREVPPPAEDGT